MLPSRSRLKRRSDFGRVYSKGRSYATDLVVVYVLPSREDGTKIGFSVSKKLGGSVARNRVRRLLGEAAWQFRSRTKAGYNIIVVARMKASGATLSDISAALGAALTKSGMLDAGNL